MFNWKALTYLLVLCFMLQITQAAYSVNSTAGVQMRIVKKVLNRLKDDIFRTSPVVIPIEIKLEETYQETLNLFFADNKFKLSNVEMDKFFIDLETFKLNFPIW